MIGTTVSHYRILAKLGEGGMGVVYKAEDVRLGRTVALKFLPDDVTSDAAVRERFTREARLASSLQHQNICTVHEIDETDDGRLFIVMPCYEGESLKDVLDRGPLPASEAVKLALQMARGLAAAHEAGVVHRDVKPGNVMVSSGGHVRLVDFGLAKLTGQTSITRRGSAVGTVAYMSPEQARGEEAGPSTDVWSLGVVLYEMVTGRRPFDGESERAVMRAIGRDRETPLLDLAPDAPPELAEIVRKALSKNPAARYRNMGDMLEDLRSLARRLETGDSARTDTWKFTVARERRLRLVAVLSASAVFVLVILWAVSALQREEPVPRGVAMQITDAGGWEGEPAISPDGSRVAYVSSRFGHFDIFVTDVLGGRTLRMTDDPGADFDPAWFPDGSEIAFTSDRKGKRSVWRVGQFGGGATLLLENAECPAISPDGSRIAFSRPHGGVALRIWVASVDDPSDARAVTTAEDGDWDHVSPAWSPDGRKLCYGVLGELWVVDVETGAARRLVENGDGDGEPVWSSDGRYIYFESRREGTLALWRVRSGGGEPQRMTEGIGYEGEPSVSRDGSRLAYSSGGPATGTVIIKRDTGERIVLGRMRMESTPALGPDGGRVVYVSRRWDRRGELAEQTLVGGEPFGPPRRLTDQEGTASHPACSPDGLWVAYYLIVGDERDLWVVPTSGGSPRRITEGDGANFHPAWSPDGTRLAFISDRSGSYDVWVVPVSEGKAVGEPRRLTDGRVQAYAPAWSLDGSRVAFVGSSGDVLDVWVVPSDGHAPARRLTRGLEVTRVRWDAKTGSILAAATNGGSRRSLWEVSPETGAVVPSEFDVVLGSARTAGIFDVSADGSLLVFSQENLTGDIWVSDGPPGLF